MNEQWLALLLICGVIVLSIHLSCVTWKWFLGWQSRLVAEMTGVHGKAHFPGLFRR